MNHSLEISEKLLYAFLREKYGVNIKKPGFQNKEARLLFLGFIMDLRAYFWG